MYHLSLCDGDIFHLLLFVCLQKTDVPVSVGLKRSPAQSSTSTAAKRKPSPIRFDVSSDKSTGGAGGTGGGGRKLAREIYRPPRDQFSKKVSNGASFPDFGAFSGRGRGRGRGRRRGRGRGSGGTWRQY